MPPKLLLDKRLPPFVLSGQLESTGGRLISHSNRVGMPSATSRLYRRLAVTASLLASGLIVLGGIVRITGSGLGCGEHWPRCNGEWFPPLDLPTLIEIGHRWAAALVSIFVLLLAVVAWWKYRAEPRLRNPATLALGLLIVQVLLGAVTVKFQLPPEVVTVHLANAMVLLAVLMVAAMRASGLTLNPTTPALGENWETGSSVRPPVFLALVYGFTVVLLGGLVANYHAGLLCQGFPLCNGSLLPPPTRFAVVHWAHRVAAFTFLVYLTWLVFYLREQRQSYRAAWLTLGLVLLQVGVAATMVLRLLPAELRVLHLLLGTAIWASLVRLAWVDRASLASVPRRRENGFGIGELPPTPALLVGRRPPIWADLVTLTKPRIISLLLVTTLAPMFITGRGLPSLALVTWVMIGGYLMAGGANAINMWFDRDIDDKMTRTRQRPIPSGRLAPAAALAFGCLLGGIAFAIFYIFANPLSAWLALAGLLFYVLVYTVWLKRSSPQNIVIGGAAGAFPPLVGWTAMTGRLDLTALYLFAIIFYWTPPHFWALALIKQGEYARAGIPMMPVVRGDRYTKVQMLGYTIMLVPLTLLPWLAGTMGTVYAVAAALLGARLLWYCVKLLNETSITPTAWRMYKYSLLYLFLLFGAMGLDRMIAWPSPFHRTDILVLKPQGDSTPGHQHD
jgi:protoheme IX farnesyltransferase